MHVSMESLRIKLFADGADLNGMIEMAQKPYISGLTTNPTLMRKAGVTDYVKFAKEVLNEIRTKPISFEVFSDDIDEMKKQAMEISSWGENVYVKIPITNTHGQSTKTLVEYLNVRKVKVNVTALMTQNQVEEVIEVLNPETPSCISVFAGRVADTGRDPVPLMRGCVEVVSKNQSSELIWASPRELLNIFHAEEIGCHIITATNDILKKLVLLGKDLTVYSLETVKMFHEDAIKSSYRI